MGGGLERKEQSKKSLTSTRFNQNQGNNQSISTLLRGDKEIEMSPKLSLELGG